MSTNHLAHIADRVLNRPLMILPDKLALIASVLEGRIGISAANLADKPTAEGAEGLLPEASRFVGEPAKDANGQRKPYRMAGDVAVIPVVGSLVNRGSFLDALSGVASYEAIKNAVNRAAADAEVASILLDIDSPGGEAVGAFEAAETVRAAAEKKPVVASVTGLCCSAGFAIASGASRIIVSQSSLVGSIGVVMMHVDNSKRLHDAGVVPTLIHAGAHKVDGNPLEKLTDNVKEELKAEVHRFYDLFVAQVARGRPGMTQESIRATEARTYIGADAVSAGLADAVGSIESALADLSKQPSGRSARNTGNRSNMTKTYTEEEHSAAVAAARNEGSTAAKAEATKSSGDAVTAAVTAERARFKAILALDEAKGREASAQHLATATSMSVDEAKALLATMPKASGTPDRKIDANTGLSLVDTNSDKTEPDASAMWDKVTARYTGGPAH